MVVLAQGIEDGLLNCPDRVAVDLETGREFGRFLVLATHCISNWMAIRKVAGWCQRDPRWPRRASQC